MNIRQLSEAILDSGIRSNNFFNGRLLSAEDLSREQDANRAGHQALGQTVGDGVAYGLEVSRATGAGAAPLVAVQPGLAINRAGNTLRLTERVEVSLIQEEQPALELSLGGATFSSCQPLQPGVYVSGTGVYLLVICPASGREGRALASGLNGGADCHAKLIVEGVQFRLIQLDLTPAELNDADHLRNLVAYKCFGVTDTAMVARDPFGVEVTGYGLIDQLRPTRLTDCDVPLAVINWTESEGIRVVDNWAARRRIAFGTVGNAWNALIGDRRASEAEAIFLQFADHLDSLRLSEPETVVATRYFRYLPPVGILPLARPGELRGFSFEKFFEQRVYRLPTFIEGARLEPLIRASMAFPPIDLHGNEMVWLYVVRENLDPRAFGSAPEPVDYLIFASGHIGFYGEARFDVARWGYSNFS